MTELIPVIVALLLQSSEPATPVVQALVTNNAGQIQSGVVLSLRSGSQYVGQQVSDFNGLLSFTQVPPGALRFSSNGEPRHTLSGTGLMLLANQTLNLTLIIDRGTLSQTIAIQDAAGPLGGAEASLTWTKDYSGISSSTRFRSHVSDFASGQTNFSGLGTGVHTVRVSKIGCQSVSKAINVGVDPSTFTIELNCG